MTAAVFVTRADADAYSAAVDARLGYPKPGIDVGGGKHVPPPQSATARYGDVQKHPTLAQWAYPSDPVVTAAAVALPGGAVVQPLDATWAPVTGISQAVIE